MYVTIVLDVDSDDDFEIEQAIDAINLPYNVSVVDVDYGTEDLPETESDEFED